MNRVLSILFTGICFLQGTLASPSLQAYLSHAVFYSPATGSYIETYLSIVGNTVNFTKNKDGKWQSEVEITLLFRQDSIILFADKYILLSPTVEDSGVVKPNFIDQRRIPLKDGSYNIEIEIRDVHDNPEAGGKSFKHAENISISSPGSRIAFSGIQPVESVTKSIKETILTKSGFDLVPYVSNFFPQSMSKLIFYSEIYNTSGILGENEGFLVSYYIESFESGKKQNEFARFSRQQAKEVVPMLGDLLIEKLPSGNYNLAIEIRDKSNNMLSEKRFFFQRSNPALDADTMRLTDDAVSHSFVASFMSRDSLAEYLRCLKPISTQLQKIYIDNQIKGGDIKKMKKFFLSFWTQRNGSDPGAEWKKYFATVKKVNNSYSLSNQRGYDTDRGRVFLQYGEPNSITRSPYEPSAYPYEIWHYYKTGNYSNIKFIFINEDLGSNQYDLIHSDMPGEVNDPKWQLRTHKRSTPFSTIDEEEKGTHFGGKAGEYYKNPK